MPLCCIFKVCWSALSVKSWNLRKSQHYKDIYGLTVLFVTCQQEGEKKLLAHVLMSCWNYEKTVFSIPSVSSNVIFKMSSSLSFICSCTSKIKRVIPSHCIPYFSSFIPATLNLLILTLSSPMIPIFVYLFNHFSYLYVNFYLFQFYHIDNFSPISFFLMT